jgi:hypothetical protein
MLSGEDITSPQRTFEQDAVDVRRLAAQCIGNPVRREAHEHRNELVRAAMPAAHARDAAALEAATQALRDYMPTYRRIMGR